MLSCPRYSKVRLNYFIKYACRLLKCKCNKNKIHAIANSISEGPVKMNTFFIYRYAFTFNLIINKNLNSPTTFASCIQMFNKCFVSA